MLLQEEVDGLERILLELSKFLSYEEFKKIYLFLGKDRIIKLRDNKNEKILTIPVKKLSLINEVLKKEIRLI